MSPSGQKPPSARHDPLPTKPCYMGARPWCPLSPLIGAFFLNALDERIEKSGLFYVRFMDDILVLKRRLAAHAGVAQRVGVLRSLGPGSRQHVTTAGSTTGKTNLRDVWPGTRSAARGVPVPSGVPPRPRGRAGERRPATVAPGAPETVTASHTEMVSQALNGGGRP